jgi:hypothetical protein
LRLALNQLPTVHTEEGDWYTGSLSAQGHKEGYGLLLMKQGGYYLGQWNQNNAHGYGTHVDCDNVVSEGTWKNNMLHG